MAILGLQETIYLTYYWYEENPVDCGYNQLHIYKPHLSILIIAIRCYFINLANILGPHLVQTYKTMWETHYECFS